MLKQATASDRLVAEESRFTARKHSARRQGKIMNAKRGVIVPEARRVNSRAELCHC